MGGGGHLSLTIGERNSGLDIYVLQIKMCHPKEEGSHKKCTDHLRRLGTGIINE